MRWMIFIRAVAGCELLVERQKEIFAQRRGGAEKNSLKK
jgi:hypothetical protein